MPQQRIYDAHGGVVSTVTYDDAEKKVTYAQYQDVNPILEYNKQLRADGDGYTPSRELRRVASIPNTVVLKWCREAGIPVRDFLKNWKRNPHYKKWFFGKIYDSENSAFLTAPRWSNRYVPVKAHNGDSDLPAT